MKKITLVFHLSHSQKYFFYQALWTSPLWELSKPFKFSYFSLKTLKKYSEKSVASCENMMYLLHSLKNPKTVCHFQNRAVRLEHAVIWHNLGSNVLHLRTDHIWTLVFGPRSNGLSNVLQPTQSVYPNMSNAFERSFKRASTDLIRPFYLDSVWTRFLPFKCE
jgi:hypothetical protein